MSIPTTITPLGVKHIVLLDYIERDLSSQPSDITTKDWRYQLWMGNHRVTDPAGVRITCEFSTQRSGYGGNTTYPLFFGTWKLRDADTAVEGVNPYSQYINYIGGSDFSSTNATARFIFCQRQGAGNYHDDYTMITIPLNHTRISAAIAGHTGSVEFGGVRHTLEIKEEAPAGDYGYPFLGNYNGWQNRYYHYTLSDAGYLMDCVPAYNKKSGLYGMYDLVHRRFYGSPYMTGA